MSIQKRMKKMSAEALQAGMEADMRLAVNDKNNMVRACAAARVRQAQAELARRQAQA